MQSNDIKLDVRGYQYHIQTWGDSSKPILFLLHGWMDCGASYKFMMPLLADSFYLVAPDWRGFGQTEHTSDTYWFQDYFADLEVILDHFAPDQAVDIVGHSMGGNIALLYAGIRSSRVKRVLSLEGLGLPSFIESDMHKSLNTWLDQVTYPEPAKIYADWEALKRSVTKGNPGLSDELINELMQMWGKEIEDGQVMLKADHKHRFLNPLRYTAKDFQDLWSHVEATVGVVLGNESAQAAQYIDNGVLEQAQKIMSISDNHVYKIAGAHHMMHIEYPEITAQHVLDFMC